MDERLPRLQAKGESLLFGKTMENVCNHVKRSFVTKEERLNKLVNPSYVRHKTINENLHVLQTVNDRVLLIEPVYNSKAILEDTHVRLALYLYNEEVYPKGM